MFTLAQVGRQPIHCASGEGHLALVCELIEQYSVDPNALDLVIYERSYIR